MVDHTISTYPPTLTTIDTNDGMGMLKPNLFPQTRIRQILSPRTMHRFHSNLTRSSRRRFADYSQRSIDARWKCKEDDLPFGQVGLCALFIQIQACSMLHVHSLFIGYLIPLLKPLPFPFNSTCHLPLELQLPRPI